MTRANGELMLTVALLIGIALAVLIGAFALFREWREMREAERAEPGSEDR
jgi:hypothetical protein